MHKAAALATAITLSLLSASSTTDGASQPAHVPRCRDYNETSPDDRVRLQQALALARAIHKAEGLLLEQTRNFQPFARLENLPPTPRGFKLRFYGDSHGYILSLRDDLDPCHFAIFSDESGRTYARDAGALKMATAAGNPARD
jgi:hypothetical protein